MRDLSLEPDSGGDGEVGGGEQEDGVDLAPVEAGLLGSGGPPGRDGVAVEAGALLGLGAGVDVVEAEAKDGGPL